MPIPIEVKVDTEAHPTTTRMVRTTTPHIAASIPVEPCMPCCGTLLISVAFPNVELHAIGASGTAGFWALTITVVIVGVIWMIRRDGVKVVVHTPLGTTVVEVKLQIPTKHIE